MTATFLQTAITLILWTNFNNLINGVPSSAHHLKLVEMEIKNTIKRTIKFFSEHDQAWHTCPYSSEAFKALNAVVLSSEDRYRSFTITTVA